MDGVHVTGWRHAPKSYELGGRIMLSSIVILFAVVLFIICLHIYARWFLRPSRRNQYRRHRRRTHLVFNSAVSVPSRGLDATILRSLPVFVFSTETNDDQLLECAVCLSEFQENEKGRRLPKCNHSFHIDCIDMWFHSHSTCPLCRVAVKPDIPAHVIDIPVQVTETPGNATEIPVELVSPVRDGAGESDTELCSSSRHGEETGSSSSSSSSSSKKNLLGFMDVPKRNENFRVLEEELGFGSPAGQGLKSPGGRMRSFKKILSRERKGSDSHCGSVTTETDIESGDGRQV